MKNIVLLFLISLFPLITLADLVTEGEVSHRFSIENLDDYPEYEFYILRTSFYYDRGYQPGGVSEVPVSQGKYFLAGDRYATSPLYARMKEGGDSVGVSSIELGGKQVVGERNAQYIQDEYKIVSIEDGVIELQLVEQKIILRNGKEINLKKGAVSTGIEIWGIDLIIFALPVACLFGIVFFFLYRRRQARRQSA